jgi:hypothetical protein
VEVIPQLHLKAHHLHGPEMFSQLPSILSLDGRVELKKLFEYLTQIDLSSSRRRTAVLFTPDTTPSPSSSSTHLVNNEYLSLFHNTSFVQTFSTFLILFTQLTCPINHIYHISYNSSIFMC